MNFMEAGKFNDRDLIDRVISAFYIIDYGFVDRVNDDKTVDVVHAVRNVTMENEVMPETKTTGLEVLTISCNEFSVSFAPKKGDKVLLLALRNYLEKTSDVKISKEPEVFIHYQRETMKVLPFSAFNSEAKVKIEFDNGTVKVDAEKNIELNADKNIELNGNTKSFVTYAELNQALTKFTTLLNTHVHECAAPGSPSLTPTPQMTIDISAAETKTIKTGG